MPRGQVEDSLDSLRNESNRDTETAPPLRKEKRCAESGSPWP